MNLSLPDRCIRFFCKTSFSSSTINSKQVLKGCPDRWEGLVFQEELVVTGWEEHFGYRICAKEVAICLIFIRKVKEMQN